MGIDLSPEDIEEMDAEKVLSEVNDAIDSLESKRDELLDEKKDWQEKAKERRDELEELESRVNELREEAATKEGDIEEVKQQIKEQKEKEIEQEREKKKKYEQGLQSTLIDKELTEALNQAEVASPYIQPLRSQLRSDIEVVENDDGEFEAVAKDGAMNKSVQEHVEDFLDEQGREHYTSAPSNSGGGAGSGGSGGSGGTDNPLDKANDSFSMTAASQFVKNNDEETVEQKLKEAQDPVQIDASVGTV